MCVCVCVCVCVMQLTKNVSCSWLNSVAQPLLLTLLDNSASDAPAAAAPASVASVGAGVGLREGRAESAAGEAPGAGDCATLPASLGVFCVSVFVGVVFVYVSSLMLSQEPSDMGASSLIFASRYVAISDNMDSASSRSLAPSA